jgi:integrase
VRVANVKLVARGYVPIGWLTCHALRRTYCSLQYESGCTPLYVADQMGHTPPAMSLEMYAKVMNVKRDVGVRMDALISARISESEATAQPAF